MQRRGAQALFALKKEDCGMNIFEQIEDMAREAWGKSESGELERPEYNRLVNIVCCIADKLAIEARRHEDCFYFADTGSPIFPLTISGLNKVHVWLQQEQQRRDSDVLLARKKEKEMNQIDQQDPCELLRTAGFTEAEIEHLERLRQAYSENSSWLTCAEERRLAFVRWLVTTGRLTEQVEARRQGKEEQSMALQEEMRC
jgi:hypothetical protein